MATGKTTGLFSLAADGEGVVSWRQDSVFGRGGGAEEQVERGGRWRGGFRVGGGVMVVWGLRAVVGYASATCLAWHLLLLDSKDVGLRVWLSLSGFSLNQKWGECCTLLHPVITITLKPLFKKTIFFLHAKVCRECMFAFRTWFGGDRG